MLFVADTQNNRVMVWNTLPTKNNQPADFVLGQPNFTTSPNLDLTKELPHSRGDDHAQSGFGIERRDPSFCHRSGIQPGAGSGRRFLRKRSNPPISKWGRRT